MTVKLKTILVVGPVNIFPNFNTGIILDRTVRIALNVSFDKQLVLFIERP